jgi:ATP-dependent DNA helicase RecG
VAISVAQIDLWRRARSETEHIEFKEAKNQIDFGELCGYSVAIGNEGGGHLLLGIANAPPRPVVGSRAIENPRKTASQVFQKVGFRVDIEAVAHPQGRVVVVQIPSRPNGTAFHLEGKYLMRSGSSLVPMTEDRLRKIFLEGEPDWLEEAAVAELSAAGVLEILDTDTLFRLLKLPYPTRPAGVKEKLVSMRLVDRQSRDTYAVRRVAGILLAQKLAAFPELELKAARVVVYGDSSKVGRTIVDRTFTRGYAVEFQRLVKFINRHTQQEIVRDALRHEMRMVPEIAVRETIANALVHQDIKLRGGSVMVEVFSDRVEISNPGEPVVPVDRFIDCYRSRNERLTALMRSMRICEERSMGIDLVVSAAESHQLPAPDFRVAGVRTIVTVYGPRRFEEMDREDRVRACYQHCVLKYVNNERMTNQSLRERFKLPEHKSAIVSQIITAAIDAKKIRLDEKVGTSRRFARYIPEWA